MVSAEEKNEFVDKIIAMAYEDVSVAEIQKQVNGFLLRDTSSGKLYKYRTFDANGYSLKNLEAGTLHCSRPEAFNDPFDCNIGMSTESLNDVLEELISDGINQYIAIVRGEKTLSECEGKGSTVLEKYLENPVLVRLITSVEEINGVQEIIEVIQVIIDFSRDIISAVITNKALLESLGKNMTAQALNSISPLVMQKLIDEKMAFCDYACANGVVGDVDAIEAMLQLGQIQYPETKDTIESVRKSIDKIVRDLFTLMNEACKIGCLSTDYKNRLMWSHYADSHKGFCIEYDFSDTGSDIFNRAFLFPVVYSEKRPAVPWKAALVDNSENRIEARMQMTKTLLTKDAVWEYENEWRILLKNDNAELKMPKVTCIYLGAAISEENRNRILEIARNNNIPIKQMWTDRGSYELHAVEI